MRKHITSVVALLATLSTGAFAQSAGLLTPIDSDLELSATVELGMIDVYSNVLQQGQNGTAFEYVTQGGQDILFRFARASVEIGWRNRHSVVLLIQPLDVRTQALLDEDIIVDGLTFPSGTAMDLRYGFDFYRLSYLFDLLPEPERELAIGVSLQVRDASISFASQAGDLFRITQDVGPVPILKARGRAEFGGTFVGFEVDGFYADGRYISGSTNDFIGAIVDASLRGGILLRNGFEAFLNLRYLGGGARGVEENDPEPGDGFTDNWLHAGALTVGVTVR